MSKAASILRKAILFLPTLALGLLISSLVVGAQAPTLSQCYASRGEALPSVSERAVEAAKYGIWQYRGTADQNAALRDALCPPASEDLGFSVVTDFQKSLSAQMTATQSFVQVSSLTLRDGTTVSMSDFGAQVFLTLEPGAAKEEIVACTNVDTSLSRFTGCTRGLAFKGTATTAVTANQKTHAAGSTVVISNVHYVYDQFLDRTGRDQDIAGVKTFTSSTIQIGDDTTSTAKYIKFPVNQGTEPYFKVVGPGNGASTSTFYFSIDGVSDLQLNASGTVFAVSSTRGIFITNGLIGINASTTHGLAFAPTSGFLYLNASSTGGIGFASDGSAQVDGSDPFAFTNTVTFSGAVTSTGSFRVTQAPTIGNDVVNLSYLLSSASGLTATSTAAAAITAGKALYVTVTSTALMTDTANGTSTFFFIGFATANASAAAEVTYTRPGGVNCSQSGLTPGAYYYLNGSSGAISALAAANSARVGMALTATCIQVLQPRYKLVGSTSTGTPATGSTFRITTFFYPASVSAVSSGAGSLFFSVSTDSNSGVIGGAVDGAMRHNAGDYLYFEDEGGSCYWRGSVAKDQYGFTVTNTNYSGAGCGNMTDTTILYTVSSE